MSLDQMRDPMMHEVWGKTEKNRQFIVFPILKAFLFKNSVKIDYARHSTSNKTEIRSIQGREVHSCQFTLIEELF